MAALSPVPDAPPDAPSVAVEATFVGEVQLTVPVRVPVEVIGHLEPVPRVGCTVDEAADALGLSRDSVMELVRAGELAARQHGRRWVVSVASLAAWVDGGAA